MLQNVAPRGGLPCLEQVLYEFSETEERQGQKSWGERGIPHLFLLVTGSLVHGAGLNVLPALQALCSHTQA